MSYDITHCHYCIQADLLIVMGSSLKVKPVSLIPGMVQWSVSILTSLSLSIDLIPPHIPQILINREPLNYMKGFDVRLLGYSDTVVSEICRRLGPSWMDDVQVTDSSGKALILYIGPLLLYQAPR